jgi:hypothetical protein
VLYALFIQLPGQVIREILGCAGYTPDQGVRPGGCPHSVYDNYNCVTVARESRIGSLASFFSSACGPGEGTAVEPSGDLLTRLRARLRPYGAVMDARLEEGGGCVTDDEEEEEENACRDGCCQGCCQSRGNAMKRMRLLFKTLLFVSSVVVFVGSFKDGEGEGDP